MTETVHYKIPVPDEARSVADEFVSLQTALSMIDALIKSVNDSVAGKAASSHAHGIEAISGLSDALAAKMDGARKFTLAELTDVVSAEAAAAGYILSKNAEGKFYFASASALLTNHNHTVEQVLGLQEQFEALGTIVGRDITISDSAPSGGQDGDIWLQV